ncbi:M56 family metallopeptidase [Legionella quinlivanii]|uniref:M56 family metallopeptidase n=1 Tax=Legionella quinlivanii TaxID=45073 RepID=UPI0022430C74|nr:M56 family metallopeptidase [Legionella quinlivanii]MCW8450350.1 penicillin-binding transpeptidase domain-containing protein [Legionella quinlivanii]
MLFLEIVLSIHCLILLSSWFIRLPWLTEQPSLKLKLTRLLLASCVISPLIIQSIPSTPNIKLPKLVSLDSLQHYIKRPVVSNDLTQSALDSPLPKVSELSYLKLFLLLFSLFISIRTYWVYADWTRLRSLLSEAIPYRSAGRLRVKVSDQCHIPFSVNLFGKAYIVLPVSLLSTPKYAKIAIAHEGQHHRNGDCVWAYIVEVLRIIFFANPGMAQWQRILSDLQECACDEKVVNRRNILALDYGRCLFHVVQNLSCNSMQSIPAFACTVGMALSKENKDSAFIIRRISMLNQYSGNRPRKMLSGTAIAVFSILLPLCVAYSATGTLSAAQIKEMDLSALDQRIQTIAEKEVSKAINQYHAKSAVVAIADARTGNLIAFAELSQSKGYPSWKSRLFSPGSTIKPFIAAAAMDSGKSSENQVYDCSSPYSVNGKTFRDSDPGITTASLSEALAKSINVCLIKVTEQTGAPIIKEKLSQFGFDMKTGWQSGQNESLQLAETAVGENIPVTIGSLTQSYAILANKGHLFSPARPAVISEQTASSITHMLENVVKKGTGKLADIPDIAVAGKTGTLLENPQDPQGLKLALFAGYIPANAPRYVITVIVEEGHFTKNGEVLSNGGELAAPVFREIAIESMNVSATR